MVLFDCYAVFSREPVSREKHHNRRRRLFILGTGAQLHGRVV